ELWPALDEALRLRPASGPVVRGVPLVSEHVGGGAHAASLGSGSKSVKRLGTGQLLVTRRSRSRRRSSRSSSLGGRFSRRSSSTLSGRTGSAMAALLSPSVTSAVSLSDIHASFCHV